MNKQTEKSSPIQEPISISDYLDRMISDGKVIYEKLMNAPADMTGDEEPKLHDLINEIREKLNSAKRVWG